MRRIDMIFSQKAAEQGKGGGTTLNAIKNLGLGLEVIDISLVKAPNQSEAQVLSLKSVGEMIAKATATLKQEFISKFRSVKETIADEDRQEGDEIMTKEQLLAIMVARLFDPIALWGLSCTTPPASFPFPISGLP